MRRRAVHPSRSVVLLFLRLIVLRTLLLRLPALRADGQATPWPSALFTVVSAVCVIGLVVLDTGTHRSLRGQAVILGLFRLGGFDPMVAASPLGLMVNRSLRLRARLMTQAETRSPGLGDVASVASFVLLFTLVYEPALALVLTWPLHAADDLPIAERTGVPGSPVWSRAG